MGFTAHEMSSLASMFIYSRDFPITVSGGTGADAGTFKHEILKQIIITPPVNTAQYDFAITNPNNIGLFDVIDEEGTMNESVEFLMRDMHTFTITNATEDGVYTVTLISYEPHG